MDHESNEYEIRIIRDLRERISRDPNLSPEAIRNFRLVTTKLIAERIIASSPFGSRDRAPHQIKTHKETKQP